MKLQIFKTLWGHSGSYQQAADEAIAAGFDGIEGPIPQQPGDHHWLAEILENNALLYIAEVCTAGSYVPQRHADVVTHLASMPVASDA